MTEKEYRVYPAISRSQLWRLNDSPEKFKYFEENPQEPTPTLLFGQVAHKLLLQPDKFTDEYAIAPTVDRRSTSGKEAYSAFLEASEGKTVVPIDMFQKAFEMAEKAAQEPLVAKLLLGEREKPYFWTDEMTGEACKCRVDCITDIGGKPVIVDYKTCTNADTDTFMRDAIRHGYDLQSAMYSEGVERNIGSKPLFVFVVQEKEPPYAVNILQAEEPFIQHGYDLFRELMGIYHYCRTSGNWYGYTGRDNIINSLSLPAWLAKE